VNADKDAVLQALTYSKEITAAGGNTVVVIEHNLDIIKIADHCIDMGPEGGVNGGTVIAQGTPEELTRVTESHTGRFLKKILEKGS